MIAQGVKYEQQCLIMTGERLEADLCIPLGAKTLVLFAHGSGSSRQSNRNRYVSQTLNNAGFATLLVDLLTPSEKLVDEETRHLRYNIDLLAKRLLEVTHWLLQEPRTCHMKIGYFGSSTGAAASLIAAGKLDIVRTIVCRGGRPDLAESSGLLKCIVAPTLFIVGGNDTPLIPLTKAALGKPSGVKTGELAIIPGAGHLFEEPGKMEELARIATEWFECHLLENGRKFENKYKKMHGQFGFIKNRFQARIVFKNRVSAGSILASMLSEFKKDDSVTVIGIPRGGAMVASEVARQLATSFDIIFPRKLRSPYNSESAIGAIMDDGTVYLDEKLVASMKISEEYLDLEKSEQRKEIRRRMSLYRPEPREYNITDKTVILVDDGAASGATITVASRWIKNQGSRCLVVGLPVAPRKVVDLLSAEADRVEVITIASDSKFSTVEHSYQNFDPVSDDQVLKVVGR